MLRSVLLFLALLAFIACQPQTQTENSKTLEERVFAPFDAKLSYVNPARVYRAGDTLLILDTTDLHAERVLIRAQIFAWQERRKSPAMETEPIRLSLGHRFYLQSELKRRQAEGEQVPQIELIKNDYEIMLYQEQMRSTQDAIAKESQFYQAQMKVLEAQLGILNSLSESAVILAQKDRELLGAQPMLGRWYPKGAVLMELH